MTRRIGELLVDAGALTELDLRQALLQQKKQGGKPRLGELLLSQKKVTPAALAHAIAEQSRLTFIELPTDIPPAISRRLTVEFQKKHGVIPFRKDVVSGVDQIHVAVADPTQKEILEQIGAKFREVLRFYVATPADVTAAIDRASRPPAAAPPAAPRAPAPADPLDDLLGGVGASAAPSGGADPLDDLLGGVGASAAPSGGADPLDDLLGGVGASAAPSGGADPLDDLLGGAPSAPSAAPAPAASAAGRDPLDDLLGGAPSAPSAAPAPSGGTDPLDDLFGESPSAPAAPAPGDPLDDLLGGDAAAPAVTGGDPLSGLEEAPSAPSGPQTPPAYVHMFLPKPRPVAAPADPAPAEALPLPDGPTENEVTPPSGTAFDELVPEAAPSADGPTENEVTPPSGTAFDGLVPVAAPPAEPSISSEDAWLLQELHRLASGEPAHADALGTVASVVRMLVRKGIIQQEALLGELGR